MGNLRKLGVLLVFIGIFDPNAFGQDLLMRISMPHWIEMGMSKAEIQRRLGKPFVEEIGGLIYKSTLNPNDVYDFAIHPEKNLVSFSIVIDYDYNQIENTLVNIYGNTPFKKEDFCTWMFLTQNSRNLFSISLGYNEEGKPIIMYVFKNL